MNIYLFFSMSVRGFLDAVSDTILRYNSSMLFFDTIL
jgi:hypothetical protein